MSVWIMVSLATASIVLCIVVCVMEVVKDIRRWNEIYKSAEKRENPKPTTADSIIYYKRPEISSK